MRLLSRPLPTLLPLVSTATLALAGATSGVLPHEKTYSVNLGSWLLLEAWMLPAEWLAMGGQNCDACADCISTEFAFAKAYPDTVDEIFNGHWETWFSQDDVDKLVAYGINTVRIPLGYWIVEPLVNRTSEFYPRGGILQLKRGLSQLKAAGISAILDHHALPGVQTANQQFAGQCTSDVEFYTDYNYHRALVWTAVMTAISHLDPDFGSVFSIEAVNEEIMDPSQTPGYGGFQKNFVQTIRAVEAILGIITDDIQGFQSGALDNLIQESGDLTQALVQAGTTTNGTVISALVDAASVLLKVAKELGISDLLNDLNCPQRQPLTTMFMDAGWQNMNGANPADAADGPQAYDNHLYYAFGGVADANEDAYMRSICNLSRVEADAAVGNSPLVFGEWSLATQWDLSIEFGTKWADAQKLQYSKGAGWLFWNFKTEESELAGNTSRAWSYFKGVELGMFTIDPSQLNDPDVCVPYLNTTAPTSTTSQASATSTSSSSATAIDATSTLADASDPTETLSDAMAAPSGTLRQRAQLYAEDTLRMERRRALKPYYVAREESLQF